MLKKIFKAAKKAAPIIGGTIGFALGGPMGASIGSGLGSLAGGRNVQDSLRNAALGYAGGYAAQGLGATGGQGLGGLFGGAGSQGVVAGSGSGVVNGVNVAGMNKALAASQNPSLISKALGLAKAYPKSTALAALGLGALASGGEEEEEVITMDDITGTKGTLRDLQSATIMPNQRVPYGQMGNAYGLADGGLAHLAGGGYMNLNGFSNQVNDDTQSLTASDNIDNRIMQNLQFEQMAPGMMGYADGGDFPRKNGPIAGPGTETSDEVPAMLSDGEFVVNARTVRGLGAAMGGKNKEDERDRGSNFLYSIQDNYGERA